MGYRNLSLHFLLLFFAKNISNLFYINLIKFFLHTDKRFTHRSLYTLVKELDELKQPSPQSTTDAVDLFSDTSITASIRLKLINQCEQLLFQPNVLMAKKSREILWRKGYYDYIVIAKRLKVALKKSSGGGVGQKARIQPIVSFIRNGIDAYKTLVIRIEHDYKLDLRNIVDFSILVPFTDLAAPTTPTSPQHHSLDIINFALETVHAIIISIGDLHRYMIEFNDSDNEPNVDARDTAARYYLEAFKLNPHFGMAQNQLGTLYAGANYDLDSTYYYLYSLMCPQPFDLSEMNVAKIFATNLQYLEMQPIDSGASVTLADFLARFKLIADIFFYDKDVTDFNALCHRTLIDLRALMTDKRSQMTGDILYKLVATMLICMYKLQKVASTRRFSLNAFLVAICSELVDSCILHLKRYIDAHAKQNATFHETYGTYFELFDREVRRSREAHQQQRIMADSDVVKVALQPCTVNGKSSQVSNDSGSASGGIMNEGGVVKSCVGSGSSSLSIGTAPKDKEYSSDIKSSAGGKSAKVTGKKKPLKMRRRRKKLNSSDTDYESYDESSSSSMDDDSSEYDMNSDFSSDESSVMDVNSSDNEEEPIAATVTDTLAAAQNKSDVEDVAYFKQQLDANYESLVAKMWPSFTMDDDDADIVIEAEENIIETGNSSGRSSVAGVECAVPPLPMLPSGGEKLRYKRKYTKVDPNILIDFSYYECTIKAIKILFDWLKGNADILQNCYSSNPEFVHKIMTLLNHLNIDVFTRKVWFDRQLIRTPFVREGLRELFNIRASIPLAEDMLLKGFPLLDQNGFDFELPLVMQIGVFEEAILRCLKLVDFGFFICKSKKFRYNFCARSRRFIEVSGGGGTADQRGGGVGGRQREKRKSRKERRRVAAAKRRTENGLRGKRVMLRGGAYSGSNDDLVGDEGATTDGGGGRNQDGRPLLPKKSYLKNRSLAGTAKMIPEPAPPPVATENNKSELMGKLWLRNEVQALESKVAKKPNSTFTPYLVMDAMALAEYATIVKNLVKSKKFVVLIPNAGKRV